MNNETLRAEFDLDFTYTRTYDEVQKKFFTALKNKKFLGIKAVDGRVLCPPQSYDPVTSDPLTEWVELGHVAYLDNWCWVNQPLEKHPLDKPFAWGLLKLEGADSCMLHAVSLDSADQLEKNLKLKPVWAETRLGCIRDILYFEKA